MHDRIVVVGGGIAGLAAAYHLACAGARSVTLCEREPLVATHSSARNAAIYVGISGGAWGVLSRRTRERLDDLLGRGRWLRANGFIYAAAEEAGLREEAAFARAAGAAYTLLGRRELESRVPALTGGLAEVGVLLPEAGVLDIHLITSHLAERAQASGVRIVLGAEVARVRVVAGRAEGVELIGGDVLAADAVVLAPGAWASPLGASCGAALPLQPLRRHLGQLDPADPVDEHGPTVWSLGEGEVYFRPESGGVLASPCDEVPWPPSLPPTDADALIPSTPRWRWMAAGRFTSRRLTSRRTGGSAMPYRYSSAVVLGASMSGLLVARALSHHFERITIVERDVLPARGDVRKGVPQSAHAHGLLASGYRVMDAYFPGMMDELEALGAPRGDVVGDFLWFQYGRWKLRHRSGLRGITVSRPCLEAAIRQRVKSLPNVTFRESWEGLRPAFDADRGRVTGLVVRGREEGAQEILDAELVVDASGRGSQSPKWLDELGCGRPAETVVKVDVGYATRTFQRRRGEFFDSIGGIISGTPPESTRYAAVLAAEGDRWVVTLVGTVGDYPPTAEQAWVAFAATLPVAAVHELVTSAKPLTDIVSYRFPANQRRLYERMPRFPAGYLVVGDAVCSFNPIYGQGMSVAATEAETLDEVVEAGLDGLSRRFYGRARKLIDIPWAIATGEDLRFPQVEGRRPPGFGMVNRYLERVHAVASEDAVVCRRFFDVLNLLAPPTALMSPRMAWRVLARRAPAALSAA